MSTPTKIYLAVVAVLAVVWLGIPAIVGASGDHGPRYITDPDFLLDHSDRFTGVLRGRVDLQNAAGDTIVPPDGALVIDVRARETGGEIARQRVGVVDGEGLFEINGLPMGLATVSVQLGGGETIWTADDIVVGGVGTLDPRLDPIGLNGQLYGFELRVFGADGEPVSGGHLAWRPAGAEGDDLGFSSIAPIDEEGQARFLSRVPVVEAVSLVPGSRTELFEELYADSSLHLGPGLRVAVSPSGELPELERWLVRAVLTPVALFPEVEVKAQGFDASDTRLYGELEPGTETALIAVARGGQYRVSWWIQQRKRHRFRTIRLESTGANLEVPGAAGLVTVRPEFPMDAFLRKVPNGR